MKEHRMDRTVLLTLSGFVGILLAVGIVAGGVDPGGVDPLDALLGVGLLVFAALACSPPGWEAFRSKRK
jgi:hypothetical protein